MRYRLHYIDFHSEKYLDGRARHKVYMDFKTLSEARGYLSLLGEIEEGWIEDLVNHKKVIL